MKPIKDPEGKKQTRSKTIRNNVAFDERAAYDSANRYYLMRDMLEEALSFRIVLLEVESETQGVR